MSAFNWSIKLKHQAVAVNNTESAFFKAILPKAIAHIPAQCPSHH